MGNFEVFNEDYFDQKEYNDIEALYESNSTKIPGSTTPAITEARMSAPNSFKTITLASAFVLYLGSNAPLFAKSRIHNDPESPNQLLTELAEYDRGLGSNRIYTEKEVEFVINWNREVDNKFDLDRGFEVFELASSIFAKSNPMTGKELDVLRNYFNKVKKSKPSLPNRL